MNLAKIYADACGKTPEPQIDTEAVANAELLKQQRENWLVHPDTVDLFKFLISREEELKSNATNGSDAGWSERNILRHLHKAKAIKEVITYVTTKCRPGSGNNSDANGSTSEFS
jgi:hypothetical protein